MEDREIYSQKLWVPHDGAPTMINISLTEHDFQAALTSIQEDEDLWRAFKDHIESIRELDLLNKTVGEIPLSDEHINRIINILEKHKKYGSALFVPFVEHARQHGLEIWESKND